MHPSDADSQKFNACMHVDVYKALTTFGLSVDGTFLRDASALGKSKADCYLGSLHRNCAFLDSHRNNVMFVALIVKPVHYMTHDTDVISG